MHRVGHNVRQNRGCGMASALSNLICLGSHQALARCFLHPCPRLILSPTQICESVHAPSRLDINGPHLKGEMTHGLGQYAHNDDGRAVQGWVFLFRVLEQALDIELVVSLAPVVHRIPSL